ncbi:hypothetical protein L2E82_01758 [Cichorium intybus]|uniref:Uncharacterized protein n=1 Tax=Cichorium intybus TaxID=13427 RepID=A0ACB9H1B8_CICIN|nr:hypothetical protein L2E82_01758 [Cichorium intybus]
MALRRENIPSAELAAWEGRLNCSSSPSVTQSQLGVEPLTPVLEKPEFPESPLPYLDTTTGRRTCTGENDDIEVDEVIPPSAVPFLVLFACGFTVSYCRSTGRSYNEDPHLSPPSTPFFLMICSLKLFLPISSVFKLKSHSLFLLHFVSSDEAIETAKLLALKEGLLAIFPSFGERYLSSILSSILVSIHRTSDFQGSKVMVSAGDHDF